MFKSRQGRWALVFLCLVLLVLALVALFFILQKKDPVLSVAFLDVGQGDAILIESPTGGQMLIDGGPDRSVLRELPRQIGIFDRSLDIVVATHPDKDHIGGLLDVFSRYDIDTFIDAGHPGETATADGLEEAVRNEKGNIHVRAVRDMRIHLGGGVYADVLYPDQDITGLETNETSVVMRLVYGETEVLLGGDAPSSVEDALVRLYGANLQSDVLKASHHGSKYSTSDYWLSAVRPSLVVISVGENSYGHPTPEVLERASRAHAPVLTTKDEGTITLISDGKKFQIKNRP